MQELQLIVDRIQLALERKNAAREEALGRSRELIRCCANTIRAVHRGERDNAGALLAQAAQAARHMTAALADHPDLYHAGYTQDALKEFAEASITFALIMEQPLPSPEEIGVPPAAYLNGLGEAMGEMRRYVLDILRHAEVGRCEHFLQVMEDVYSLLVTVDYPDSLVGGLRRTTDMVRGVLERTRGDLTMAARQDALQRSLHQLNGRVLPSSQVESTLKVPND